MRTWFLNSFVPSILLSEITCMLQVKRKFRRRKILNLDNNKKCYKYLYVEKSRKVHFKSASTVTQLYCFACLVEVFLSH